MPYANSIVSRNDTLSKVTLPPERLVDPARDTLRLGLIEATSNDGGSAAAKDADAATTFIRIWNADLIPLQKGRRHSSIR
jgi:hypothetical protein